MRRVAGGRRSPTGSSDKAAKYAPGHSYRAMLKRYRPPGGRVALARRRVASPADGAREPAVCCPGAALARVDRCRGFPERHLLTHLTTGSPSFLVERTKRHRVSSWGSRRRGVFGAPPGAMAQLLKQLARSPSSESFLGRMAVAAM